MMTLNNHYHYVEILSPWGFRKRFSSHIHTSNPNEQSVKKTFVCNCQHLAKAGDERMKWTMALESFQWVLFFPTPKHWRWRKEAFLSWTMSSREEGRSFQLPYPLVQEVISKGAVSREKQEPVGQYLFIVLYPVNLSSFKKLRAKKHFGSCLLGPPPNSTICFLYFLCCLLNICGLDSIGFIPTSSLIINVLIIG